MRYAVRALNARSLLLHDSTTPKRPKTEMLCKIGMGSGCRLLAIVTLCAHRIPPIVLDVRAQSPGMKSFDAIHA